jgi:hypothetical protein
MSSGTDDRPEGDDYFEWLIEEEDLALAPADEESFSEFELVKEEPWESEWLENERHRRAWLGLPPEEDEFVIELDGVELGGDDGPYEVVVLQEDDDDLVRSFGLLPESDDDLLIE